MPLPDFHVSEPFTLGIELAGARTLFKSGSARRCATMRATCVRWKTSVI